MTESRTGPEGLADLEGLLADLGQPDQIAAATIVDRVRGSADHQTIVARVRTDDGRILPVRRRHLAESTLSRGSDDTLIVRGRLKVGVIGLASVLTPRTTAAAPDCVEWPEVYVGKLGVPIVDANKKPIPAWSAEAAPAPCASSASNRSTYAWAAAGRSAHERQAVVSVCHPGRSTYTGSSRSYTDVEAGTVVHSRPSSGSR